MNRNLAALKVPLESDNIDLSIQGFNDDTTLLLAADVGNPAIIVRLLATGIFDVNHPASSRLSTTALARAAAKGHEEVVKLLLSTGKVGLELKSIGQTPLQLITEPGHAGVVELFLETGGVDINATGMVHKTLPMLAAENGYQCVVSDLLDTRKADIAVQNMLNETALSLAAKNGHDELVRLLLLHVRKINFRNQDDALKATLFEGARNLDIDACDNRTQTPFTRAAVFGKVEFIRELLVCGKTVDVNAQDEYLKTPLLYAAERGHHAVVMELLAIGDRIDINLGDMVGYTPLFYAAINDHISVANRLCSTGRAKLGSAKHPVEMHVFDPMLQYIENVRISEHYECKMPDGVPGDLQMMKTNVRVPLSALAADL